MADVDRDRDLSNDPVGRDEDERDPYGSNGVNDSGGYGDDGNGGDGTRGGGGNLESFNRSIFVGNLFHDFTQSTVEELFEKPIQPRDDSNYAPIKIDRVDMKRGFCFIFLHEIASTEGKKNVESFVSAINGMDVPGLSKSLRAEFARGDGRVKRKEDDRRKLIQPSDTLFVVNFQEQTTNKQDLQMLFEPFGELVRIDMKRNFAFVQFRTVEQATKAKETTNGGKLDQSVLTVEYVANKGIRSSDGGYRDHDSRDYNNRRRGGGGMGGRGRDVDGGGRDRYRYDDDRRGGGGDRGGGRYGGGRSGGMDGYDNRGGGGGRYDERTGNPPPSNRYNDYDGGPSYMGGGGRGKMRGDSPPPRGGGGRYRPRSRSRSPPSRYGNRNSPPRGSRYDDRYNDGRDRDRDRLSRYDDDRDRDRRDAFQDSNRSGGGDRGYR